MQPFLGTADPNSSSQFCRLKHLGNFRIFQPIQFAKYKGHLVLLFEVAHHLFEKTKEFLDLNLRQLMRLVELGEEVFNPLPVF